MVKYRRRFEIIADILKVAAKGAKKTRIMYFANLSYRLLEKYLEETIRIGFLSLGDDGYRTTDKGLMFLVRYNDYSGRYSRIEKDLNSLKSEVEVLDDMCSRPTEFKSNGERRRQHELLI
jgi:predicted transcriptional regulator